MALVILTPQLLDGTIADTLSFVTGRVEGSTDILISISNYVSMVLMVTSMIAFGYLMFKTKENIDDAFFTYILLAFSVAMMISVTPQYMIVFMPFLILQLVSSEGKYRLCWLFISIGSFIAALGINNLSLLLASSEYLGMIQPEWIISGMRTLESFVFFEWDLVSIINAIGSVIEAVGIILIPVIHYSERISDKIPALGKLISGIREWKID